ncbi:response regulator transcription factor [Streptomyces sp. NPDC019224]|uniref:response regulator transcription factor n=1 Tax=Streptomyces sp. NPDC019224 TaxID=3154484 RepID=UPI00340A92ED
MRIAIIEQRSLVRHGLARVISAVEGTELLPAPPTAAEFAAAGMTADVILYGPPRTGPGAAAGPEPRPGAARGSSLGADADADADADVDAAGGSDAHADGRFVPATGSITRLAARGRVLVVRDTVAAHPILPVIRAGALGCVTEYVEERELLRAVETVSEGGLHISPLLMPRLYAELADRATGSEPRPLARREQETLRLLAGGLTHGQIGRRLGLTEATISTYVKRIRTKLDVGNKADLTRRAIELGLLSEPSRDPRQDAVPSAAR